MPTIMCFFFGCNHNGGDQHDAGVIKPYPISFVDGELETHKAELIIPYCGPTCMAKAQKVDKEKSTVQNALNQVIAGHANWHRGRKSNSDGSWRPEDIKGANDQPGESKIRFIISTSGAEGVSRAILKICFANANAEERLLIQCTNRLKVLEYIKERMVLPEAVET